MGIEQIATLMYLDSRNKRENQNADYWRNEYDTLVDQYNNLLHKSKEDESWYVEQINSRAANLTEYVDLAQRLSEERFALRDEVTALKKDIAYKDSLLEMAKKLVAQHGNTIKQQQETLESKQQAIDDLTGENNLLENRLDQKQQELTQKICVIETIKWGMKHIPLKQRIKAAAESFVRNPKYSQASLDEDMSDKMKADIEGHLIITMLIGAGENYEEVRNLFEQAKNEVRADIAEEDKEYDKLIEIRETRVQEAIDKGEDPSSVPGIWEIKAALEQKQVSEAKTANTNQKDEDEEESLRPGM